MQNHLAEHHYEHNERVQRAEQERLAKELRQENPNPAMIKLGRLLVEAGEQLQHRAQPRPSRQRRRA